MIREITTVLSRIGRLGSSAYMTRLAVLQHKHPSIHPSIF